MTTMRRRTKTAARTMKRTTTATTRTTTTKKRSTATRKTRTTATGGLVVTAEAGKEADPGEYVSFPTYYNMWKRDFKNLKVSRPAEDICKDCYVFANRHRHLAHHSARQRVGEDVSDSDDDSSRDDSSRDDNDAEVAERRTTVDLSSADAASNEEQEERELMLMQAAKHVEMARAQRALYQAKVADAIADATAGKDHAERRYTFVVNYGQNMELPVYNNEQPLPIRLRHPPPRPSASTATICHGAVHILRSCCLSAFADPSRLNHTP